jgi:hypothetical protein
MNTKYFLFALLGAGVMYLLLKILANNVEVKSQTTARFIDLVKTQEAFNLARTNEFKEIVKTSEFKQFVKTLAEEQINAMALSLTGTKKTF